MTKDIYIPEDLAGCRFIKVHSGAKNAVESGYTKTNYYEIDDPKIQTHIVKGGNYGIMPDAGICIFDADEYERLDALGVLEAFKNSKTVRTGGGKSKRHFYFRVTGSLNGFGGRKVVLFDQNDGMHLGEVYFSGCNAYCVGPTCKHPSGGRYEIEQDVPLVEIDSEEIKEILSVVRYKDQVIKEKPVYYNTSSTNTLTDRLGLTCDQFLMPNGAVREGNEIRGAHPVHGSESGKNMSINTQKNVWHCFRCNSGGDPIMALAVSRGIIRCEDAGPGCLDDPGVWSQVFEELESMGYDVEDPVSAGIVIDKETLFKKHEKKIIEKSGMTEHTTLPVNLPGGSLITEYIEYVAARSDSYPEYQHAGILSILSCLIDKNAHIELQIGKYYPNIWLLLLGRSTVARKSTAIDIANEFLDDLLSWVNIGDPGSPEAFVEVLEGETRCNRPVDMAGFGIADLMKKLKIPDPDLIGTPGHGIWVKDEAVDFFKKLKRQYMGGIQQLMCSLYDGRKYTRLLRSGQAKKSVFSIPDPYFNLFFATTPANFQEETSNDDIQSGFLLRFLAYYPDYAREERDVEHVSEETKQMKDEIFIRLKEIRDFFKKEKVCFEIDAAGLKYWNEWKRNHIRGISKSTEDDGGRFDRLSVYVMKLAILYTVAEYGFVRKAKDAKTNYSGERKMTISTDMILEACHQVDVYFLPVARRIGEMARVSENTNYIDKILGTIRRSGGVIDHAKLLRNTHIKARDFNDSLKTLKESEEVIEYHNETDGKRYYKIIE